MNDLFLATSKDKWREKNNCWCVKIRRQWPSTSTSYALKTALSNTHTHTHTHKEQQAKQSVVKFMIIIIAKHWKKKILNELAEAGKIWLNVCMYQVLRLIKTIIIFESLLTTFNWAIFLGATGTGSYPKTNHQIMLSILY